MSVDSGDQGQPVTTTSVEARRAATEEVVRLRDLGLARQRAGDLAAAEEQLKKATELAAQSFGNARLEHSRHAHPEKRSSRRER